jgi:hypothetical protein
VLGGGDPQTRLAVLEGLVLAGEVDTFALPASGTLSAALRECARADRKLRRDGGVLLNPVGKGILTILDNPVSVSAVM